MISFEIAQMTNNQIVDTLVWLRPFKLTLYTLDTVALAAFLLVLDKSYDN